MVMTFTQRLLSTLAGLDSTFHPDELAYLAATSKVEGPIRDRLAYELHRKIEPSSLVHREWRDPKKNGWIDIAITDETNHPRCLIEMKAHSGATFEAGYSEKIGKDLVKLYKAAEDDTELYEIFLFNHLYFQTALDPKYENVIKYFALQKHASRMNSFAIDVSNYTKAHWERHLTNNQLSLAKTHPGIRMIGGNYQEMPVAVHVYVVGPFNKTDLLPLSPA